MIYDFTQVANADALENDVQELVADVRDKDRQGFLLSVINAAKRLEMDKTDRNQLLVRIEMNASRSGKKDLASLAREFRSEGGEEGSWEEHKKSVAHLRSAYPHIKNDPEKRNGWGEPLCERQRSYERV